MRWLSRERDVRVARRVDEENAPLDGAALDSEDDSDGDSDDEAEDEERDERCDFIWGKGDDAIEFDTSLFPAMRGAAVFPLASSLNHSCDPNCEVAYVDDARVLVVARRTLKPGEELTIAYVGRGRGRRGASGRAEGGVRVRVRLRAVFEGGGDGCGARGEGEEGIQREDEGG